MYLPRIGLPLNFVQVVHSGDLDFTLGGQGLRFRPLLTGELAGQSAAGGQLAGNGGDACPDPGLPAGPLCCFGREMTVRGSMWCPRGRLRSSRHPSTSGSRFCTFSGRAIRWEKCRSSRGRRFRPVLRLSVFQIFQTLPLFLFFVSCLSFFLAYFSFVLIA